MSNFKINLIWLISLSAFMVLSFAIDYFSYHFYNNMIRLLSAFFLFLFSLHIVDFIQDLIVLKYRITTRKYWVEVDYLTFWWLFFPYWKSLDYTVHKVKYENTFGANRSSYFTDPVNYDTMNEAVKAVEEHKKKVSKKRKEFFSPKKREVKFM